MKNNYESFIDDLEKSENDDCYIPLKFNDAKYKEEFKTFLYNHLKEKSENFDIPFDIYFNSKIEGYQSILNDLISKDDVRLKPVVENDTSPNIEDDPEYQSMKNDVLIFLKCKEENSAINVFNYFLYKNDFIEYIKKIFLFIDQNKELNIKVSIGNIESSIIDMMKDVISIVQNSNMVTKVDLMKFRKIQFNYVSQNRK